MNHKPTKVYCYCEECCKYWKEWVKKIKLKK